jgi:hypothetical protein
MVKQLVADLGSIPSAPELEDAMAISNSIKHLASPGLISPSMYFCQTGTAVVSLHDHMDVAGPPESVDNSFTHTTQYILYSSFTRRTMLTPTQ